MLNATHTINERSRRRSPGGRPQPIALYQNLLWVGSWETDRIYAIDPATWKTVHDFEAPGRPYGIAPHNGTLHVVVSDGGEEDDRYLYRFNPETGFLNDSKTPCPQLTGSHLVSDGKRLYLGQMHERRIVTLDENAGVVDEFPLPGPCAGFGFGPGGKLFFISADDDFERLTFGTLDTASKPPQFSGLASFGFGARCLAHDGNAWFTCDREEGDIVSFECA